MSTITLQQAMLNNAQVALDRANNPALYDAAVLHHTKLKLRADIKNGTTHNSTCWQSGFTSYDWAERYESFPEEIYYDFFRGAIMNSVFRLSEGLAP